MTVTKKELGRLAGLAMSLGCFRVGVYGREWQLYCPVHLEAKKAKDVWNAEIPTHKFSVFQPYSRLSDAPLLKRDILEALARHLDDAEINGEPCDDLAKAVRG